jgi:archaellum component FlaC
MKSEKKEAYQKKVEAELEELEARINLLIAKAKNASADTRIKAQNKISLLKKKYEKVSKEISGLQSKSKEAWEEVTNGIDEALDDLKVSVDEAIEQFS